MARKPIKRVKTKEEKEFELWKRKCAGKIAHLTMTSAEIAYEYHNYKKEIYKCPFCDNFHLGSKR